jgi:hypothetical protein
MDYDAILMSQKKTVLGTSSRYVIELKIKNMSQRVFKLPQAI